MLLYLCNHSQPNIQYAVSQCACFSSNPKASHEAALKRIGRYLKGTRNKGIMVRSDMEGFNIEYFVDSDFASLWASESPDDPDGAVDLRGSYLG
eukprot:712923-Ditylum_brightwellii.AAC.1